MLRYRLEHGGREERIARAVRTGRLPELSPKIANAPNIKPGLELYWYAFAELNTCRVGGMDVGAIPWTAIAKFGEVYDMSQRQLADLSYLIREMDEEYRDWVRKSRG